MPRIALALALTTSLAPAVSADVLTVALPPTTADFPDIQAAVDAAGDGDVLVIRSATYPGFDVDGKSLTLLAQSGLVRTGPITIRHLAADQVVRFDLIVAESVGPQPALTVQNTAGRVWLQGSQFYAEPSDLGEPRAAVFVDGASDLLLTSSAIKQLGESTNPTGAPGLLVRNSVVDAYHSSVRGSDGYDTYGSSASNGGPGILVENSQVFLAEGYIQGGTGGTGSPFDCIAGNGGSAVVLTSPADELRLVGGTLQGGFPGSTFGTCAAPPAQGASLENPGGGLVLDWPGGSAKIGVAGLWPGGESQLLEVRPSDESTMLYLAFLSGGQTRVPWNALYGVQHLQLGAPPFVLGQTWSTGFPLFLGLIAPTPPAGVPHVTFLLQALELDLETGGVRLTAPAFSVAVDPAQL